MRAGANILSPITVNLKYPPGTVVDYAYNVFYQVNQYFSSFPFFGDFHINYHDVKLWSWIKKFTQGFWSICI